MGLPRDEAADIDDGREVARWLDNLSGIKPRKKPTVSQSQPASARGPPKSARARSSPRPVPPRRVSMAPDPPGSDRARRRPSLTMDNMPPSGVRVERRRALILITSYSTQSRRCHRGVLHGQMRSHRAPPSPSQVAAGGTYIIMWSSMYYSTQCAVSSVGSQLGGGATMQIVTVGHASQRLFAHAPGQSRVSITDGRR